MGDVRVVVASGESRRKIRDAIVRHHYSRNPGRGGDTYYAVYPADSDQWLAYVAVGGASNVHGVSAMLGLEAWRGNLEITRVVANPRAPKNTASHAVAAVLRRLGEDGIEWVFSYADTGQNHHGGIYQAMNAVYTGLSGGRDSLIIGGMEVHPRSVVAGFGTQARKWHGLLGITTSEGGITGKHLYILPTARDRRVRDAIRKALVPYSKPYPKREAVG